MPEIFTTCFFGALGCVAAICCCAVTATVVATVIAIIGWAAKRGQG